MALMFKEKSFYLNKNSCDYKKSLSLTSVLDCMQDLAITHAKEIGVGFDKIFELGYYWVVMYIEFERVGQMPKHTDEITVRTWPHQRSKLEFVREFEIVDSNNNQVIKCLSNWVLIDVEKRMIARGNDVEFIGEYLDKTNYSIKCPRKIGLENKEFIQEYGYLVELNDLDDNLHMNNSKYASVISNMESFDKYRLWKNMKIAFIHEARLGDVIHVGKYINENNEDCYIGSINGNPCFEAIVDWEE